MSAVQVFVVPNISNEWPLKDWDCAEAEKIPKKTTRGPRVVEQKFPGKHVGITYVITVSICIYHVSICIYLYLSVFIYNLDFVLHPIFDEWRIGVHWVSLAGKPLGKQLPALTSLRASAEVISFKAIQNLKKQSGPYTLGQRK